MKRLLGWTAAIKLAVTALVLVVLAAMGLSGCGRGQEPAAGQDMLVIYSPHAEEIRTEFTLAFQAWYKAKTGRAVEVTWPDPGGGGTQILKRLEDKFRSGRYDIDLAFGGGPIYDQMKQLGMLQPYKLPEDVLAALPQKVAGQPLYDPDFTWYGTAVSTFGLIYNKTLIRDKGLPEVTGWETPADPKYLGWVGLGDAGKSSVARKAYEIILQAYGYERGMALLAETAANAKEFYVSASEVPRNCAQGFIAAGPCIDFYAFRQMRSEGGKNLGVLFPSGLTVITPDPIGILKNAPHREVAEKFVEFVLRPEGQKLWSLPAGAPGGPRKYTLDRMPVLPSLYEGAAPESSAGKTNPFTVAPATFYDPAKENERQTILVDYLRAALVENHEGLVKAWKAVIAAGMPKDRVAELTRPLLSEDEMLRLGREVWTPILIPEDASPGKKAELKLKEEERLRQRSDMEAAWSDQLYRRYERLAK